MNIMNATCHVDLRCTECTGQRDNQQSAIRIRIEISNNQHRVQEFRVQSQNVLSLGKLYYIIYYIHVLLLNWCLSCRLSGVKEAQFNNSTTMLTIFDAHRCDVMSHRHVLRRRRAPFRRPVQRGPEESPKCRVQK